ncbi:MAG: hypothetical protein ACR2KK_24160 [Acidimicrobiales bacterium]
MRRPRLPRPSPRRLSAALAVLGLVAGIAFLVVPVEAAFGDDPLLRLEPFSPGLASGATDVDCGRPVSNFGRRAEGLSLYDLAFADACREAASRRAATAVASASVIGLLGLLGVAGTRDRDMARA